MKEIKKNKKRNVVGIIVFDGERFLLLHRKLNWVGWEFPKGGIEENEDPQKTLARELLEETGIKKFSLTSKIDDLTYYDNKRKQNTFITNYLVHVSSNSKVKINNEHVIDKEIVLEHDDFKWCFPKDAIKLLTHKNQKDSMKKAIKLLGLSLVG